MNTNYSNLEAVYDYRDPQEYIYNSDLVEFTEFGVKLKDLVPAKIVTAATFTETTSLNYSNKPIFDQPYMYGNVTIQNNRLALLGGKFNKQWVLPFKYNTKMGDVLPVGEIHFTYYPNYSLAPNSSQIIFSLGLEEENKKKKNMLQIVHSSTGDFIVNIYDKAGNEDQTLYEHSVDFANEPIAFNISFNAERIEGEDTRVKIRVFIDGHSVKIYDYAAESFDINKIRGFAFGNLYGPHYTNFSIKNFVIEDQCPGLAYFDDDFELPEDKLFPVPESRFTRDPQRVESLFNVSLERLNEIKVNQVDAADKSFYVGFTFKLGEIEYFFDRTELKWKQHLGAEDISDLGYMLAYKDYLIESGGVEFKAIPYLRSVSGNQSPSIISQVVKYDQFVPYEEHVPTALVYGYVRDALGNFLRGAKVTITPSRSTVAETGNYILPKITKTIRTGSNGYWDAQLALSTNFSPELRYNIQIIYRDEIVFQAANLRVLKEGTIKIEDLIKPDPGPTPGPEPVPPTPGPYPPDPHQIQGMFWTELEEEEENITPPSNQPDNDLEDFIIGHE